MEHISFKRGTINALFKQAREAAEQNQQFALDVQNKKMSPLPKNIGQLFLLERGDSVCDMHDGMPDWLLDTVNDPSEGRCDRKSAPVSWRIGLQIWELAITRRKFQSPLIATTLLEDACKHRGEGYLNKMLVVVAKHRDTVVLGYCWNGSDSYFYYFQRSLYQD